MKSVRYVALVAAGGMGSLWGTLAVSTVLTFLSLRGAFGVYDDAVFGAILVGDHAVAPPDFQPAGGLAWEVPQQEMSAAPFLKCTGLHRWFGGLHVIDEVSFSCRAGIVKAIIGPNGAGKTTLFNLIAGSLAPASGSHPVRRTPDGRPASPPDRAALGISRTFQATRLFPRMSVLENVMVGRHVRTPGRFHGGHDRPRGHRQA